MIGRYLKVLLAMKFQSRKTFCQSSLIFPLVWIHFQPHSVKYVTNYGKSKKTSLYVWFNGSVNICNIHYSVWLI